MRIGEQPICLSGGADGADLQWGMVAGSAGHMVVHFSFEGHARKSKAPRQEIVVLTTEQLAEADPFVHGANLALKRKFPTASEYVDNLLRRNWYQVRDSQSVYAVAEIDKAGMVAGGTAWAVQMFLDRHDGAVCPAYVFDQKKGLWFAWAGHWQQIDSPPVPAGVWAGIGSRTLLEPGKKAIRALLGYAPAR